jgi:two-component system chemotaxis response regulator CheB
VIGGSAGGVQALAELLAQLPSGLPATLFSVVHLGVGESRLDEALGRSSALPVSFAEQGEVPEPGRVYLAPPDLHLLLEPEMIRLSRAPRVNGFRPSVDALFRSAATYFGVRVVGVVLSGGLDCGTAGLFAIRRNGGLGIVQDPQEAQHSSMPRSALEGAGADRIGKVTQIAQWLAELSRKPVDREPGPPVATPGNAETRDHLEAALFAALRALEGQADVAERLARQAVARGHRLSSRGFFERANLAREQAATIERALRLGPRS